MGLAAVSGRKSVRCLTGKFAVGVDRSGSRKRDKIIYCLIDIFKLQTPLIANVFVVGKAIACREIKRAKMLLQTNREGQRAEMEE